MSGVRETATLAGGCFWCVDAVFARLKGVEQVTSGYTGGNAPAPSYEQVCSGTTGHAEAVQIRFDPEEISYADLLEVFWRIHDPTTLNRQGADTGTQYRSAIFYHTAEQRAVAEESLRRTETSRLWPDPIVTEIAQFTVFYPAEAYHQRYYEGNRHQPYCQVVIEPKLRKLEKTFGDRLKN